MKKIIITEEQLNIFEYTDNNKKYFYQCPTPHKAPDRKSPNGSEYWYGHDSKGDFIIRKSNHWSNYIIEAYKLDPDLYFINRVKNPPSRPFKVIIPGVGYVVNSLYDFVIHPKNVRFTQEEEKREVWGKMTKIDYDVIYLKNTFLDLNKGTKFLTGKCYIPVNKQHTVGENKAEDVLKDMGYETPEDPWKKKELYHVDQTGLIGEKINKN